MSRKKYRRNNRLAYRLLNALFFAVFAVIVIVTNAETGLAEPVAAVTTDKTTVQSELEVVSLVYRPSTTQTVEESTEEPAPSRYDSIELSESDINLLARIIWLEARGESFEGQQAVAEVVLNRILSDYFPDTLHDVIYEKNQFTTAGNVHNADPDSTQYTAIEAALNGPNVLPVEVVFFSRAAQNDNVWGTIGNHVFCYPWFWEG